MQTAQRVEINKCLHLGRARESQTSTAAFNRHQSGRRSCDSWWKTSGTCSKRNGQRLHFWPPPGIGSGGGKVRIRRRIAELHQWETDTQNNHRRTRAELAGPASHRFDPVIKTLGLQEAKLWVGDLPENLISLEMFIQFQNPFSLSCGIMWKWDHRGKWNNTGGSWERTGLFSLSRAASFQWLGLGVSVH